MIVSIKTFRITIILNVVFLNVIKTFRITIILNVVFMNVIYHTRFNNIQNNGSQNNSYPEFCSVSPYSLNAECHGAPPGAPLLGQAHPKNIRLG